MNNQIYHIYIIIAIAISLSAFGCTTDESRISTGTGSMDVTINIDSNVVSSNSTEVCNDAPSAEDMAIRLVSSDGQYSHSWSSFLEMPDNESYTSGAYRIEASYGNPDHEGFDAPYYYGSTDFSVYDGKSTPVTITCQLANTMLSIAYSESFNSRYPDYSVVLHSIGHGYVKYPKDEIRPVYIHPGNIDLTITLTTTDGDVTKFHPTTLRNAQANHHYKLAFDIKTDTDGTPLLILDVEDELVSDDVVFRLDDTLVNSPMPSVTTEGFNNGEPYIHDEGNLAPQPVKFNINAPGGIQAITLTSISPALVEKGWPQETDLVTAGSVPLDVWGLIYGMSEDKKQAYVDFTNVLPNINHKGDTEESLFTIVVMDRLRKVNDPVTLRVVTKPVAVDIVDVPEVLICDTEAEVKIKCTNPNIVSKLEVQIYGDNEWSLPVPIQYTPDAASADTYKLTIPIGTGGKDMQFRLCYNSTPKATGIIHRQSPPYSIWVDAFANWAMIKINTEDRYLRYLTEHLTVYVDNASTPVLTRNPDTGVVAIGSLISGHGYYITTSAMADNATPTYSNTVPIQTENTLSLPNGDFEEAENVIDNYPLLCGGRYSASVAPIFNQQNTSNVNVWLPSDGNWSTVNDKTFCTYASNHNTWYMQPSATITGECQSGSKAMKITSVGWDLAGEAIADYVQEAMPYTPYSKVVPHIANVSAGKLFLGKYKFDPSSCSESYMEGISFGSRPSALNGYFKYIPGRNTPNEHGLAKVILTGIVDGEEQIIAESEKLFHTTTDYTAFSIPIEYNHFGAKATTLKIMFASSDHIGSIEEESRGITPYYDIQSAIAIGASLYIDNLSLSY